MIGRGVGVGRMGGRLAGRGFPRPGGMFLPLGGMVFFLFTLLLVALMVVAFWRIFDKAGFPGVLGLLMLVPVVNVGVMLYLGFSDWPVLQRLRGLQAGTSAFPAASPPIETTTTVEPVATDDKSVEPTD